MKQLLLLSIFFILVTKTEETGLKPRPLKHQKTVDVKQTIAQECEKLLTSCTRLIALLAEQIDIIVKKLKKLASGEDQFFSKQKSVQLEQYKQRLITMRERLEKTVKETEQELEALERNFC